MKKHLIILSFLLCTTCSLKAQITSGEIHYVMDMDRFVKRLTNNKTNTSTNSLFIEIAKHVNNYSATLLFKKNLSYFKTDESLTLDFKEKSQKLAQVFANRGKYTTDLHSEKQYLQREALGEEMKVLQNIEKKEWRLTKDQKKIGDLLCYKAVITIEIPMGPFEIEAWYSPQIPYAHAPLDYAGSLPGIILELHTNELSYVCSSITLNPNKDIVIEWPDEKNAITQEEYKKANNEVKKKLSRF